MPGLKTADGRGIAVMSNGPRIPDLADRIEAGLRAAGIRLTKPLRRIGSDADYCGLGEQHACNGLFRDVDHAYYLGGGTGLAEALKLRGALLTFDRARAWVAKAWEIRSAQGSTFERLASASAINRHYARLRTGASLELSASPDELRVQQDPLHPERYAAQGDPAALHVLETAAGALAELIFERIDTIYRGRRALDHRGADYARLVREHEYRGVLLERVVLGQQIGRLYGDPRTASVFGNKIDGFLAERISADHDAHLRRRYLNGIRLKPGLVVPSPLPPAAALGAAVDAYQRAMSKSSVAPEGRATSS
jgi:predicted NBD/HSP70 family sugar kinase